MKQYFFGSIIGSETRLLHFQNAGPESSSQPEELTPAPTPEETEIAETSEETLQGSTEHAQEKTQHELSRIHANIQRTPDGNGGNTYDIHLRLNVPGANQLIDKISQFTGARSADAEIPAEGSTEQGAAETQEEAQTTEGSENNEGTQMDAMRNAIEALGTRVDVLQDGLAKIDFSSIADHPIVEKVIAYICNLLGIHQENHQATVDVAHLKLLADAAPGIGAILQNIHEGNMTALPSEVAPVFLEGIQDQLPEQLRGSVRMENGNVLINLGTFAENPLLKQGLSLVGATLKDGNLVIEPRNIQAILSTLQSLWSKVNVPEQQSIETAPNSQSTESGTQNQEVPQEPTSSDDASPESGSQSSASSESQAASPALKPSSDVNESSSSTEQPESRERQQEPDQRTVNEQVERNLSPREKFLQKTRENMQKDPELNQYMNDLLREFSAMRPIFGSYEELQAQRPSLFYTMQIADGKIMKYAIDQGMSETDISQIRASIKPNPAGTLDFIKEVFATPLPSSQSFAEQGRSSSSPVSTDAIASSRPSTNQFIPSTLSGADTPSTEAPPVESTVQENPVASESSEGLSLDQRISNLGEKLGSLRSILQKNIAGEDVLNLDLFADNPMLRKGLDRALQVLGIQHENFQVRINDLNITKIESSIGELQSSVDALQSGDLGLLSNESKTAMIEALEEQLPPNLRGRIEVSGSDLLFDLGTLATNPLVKPGLARLNIDVKDGKIVITPENVRAIGAIVGPFLKGFESSLSQSEPSDNSPAPSSESENSDTETSMTENTEEGLPSPEDAVLDSTEQGALAARLLERNPTTGEQNLGFLKEFLENAMNRLPSFEPESEEHSSTLRIVNALKIAISNQIEANKMIEGVNPEAGSVFALPGQGLIATGVLTNIFGEKPVPDLETFNQMYEVIRDEMQKSAAEFLRQAAEEAKTGMDELRQKVTMVISREKSTIENAVSARKESGWFGSLSRGLTLSDPYQIEINNARQKVSTMQDVCVPLLEKAEAALNSDPPNVPLARECMDGVDGICRNTNRVDTDTSHFELEQEALTLTQEVSIEAIITVGTLGLGVGIGRVATGAGRLAWQGTKMGYHALSTGLKYATVATAIAGGVSEMVREEDSNTQTPEEVEKMNGIASLSELPFEQKIEVISNKILENIPNLDSHKYTPALLQKTQEKAMEIGGLFLEYTNEQNLDKKEEILKKIAASLEDATGDLTQQFLDDNVDPQTAERFRAAREDRAQNDTMKIGKVVDQLTILEPLSRGDRNGALEAAKKYIRESFVGLQEQDVPPATTQAVLDDMAQNMLAVTESQTYPLLVKAIQAYAEKGFVKSFQDRLHSIRNFATDVVTAPIDEEASNRLTRGYKAVETIFSEGKGDDLAIGLMKFAQTACNIAIDHVEALDLLETIGGSMALDALIIAGTAGAGYAAEHAAEAGKISTTTSRVISGIATTVGVTNTAQSNAMKPYAIAAPITLSGLNQKIAAAMG